MEVDVVEGLSRPKAVRAKCLECCCWQEAEVRLCPCVDCALHPWRMGGARTSKRHRRAEELRLSEENASRSKMERTRASEEAAGELDLV